MAFNINNLLLRLSNIFTRDTSSNLYSFFSAVGNELDKVEPSQTNLEKGFAVSTATGSDLDKHGADWNTPRKQNESDNDYRNRILAVVPIYTSGPTVSTISSIVKNFTGADPIIIEYGPDSFFMGVTPMGQFIFDSSGNDGFTFQIQVQNPNNVSYSRSSLETAINNMKPARSTALFVHQGGV